MHTQTHNESIACHGCRLDLFCRFSETEGASLPIKHRLTLQKNERLFSLGDTFQHLYVIEKGAIKMLQNEPDGSELVRAFYFSGEVFGYEAIYTEMYHSSAIALTAAEVCVIDYQEFLRFLQANATLQEYFLYLMSLQLNAGAYLAANSADRKLSGFLLDMAHRLNRAASQTTFCLPMSRHDIGNYLRLTTETISRVCTRLQRNRIIDINHKQVVLRDKERLQQLADGLISL